MHSRLNRWIVDVHHGPDLRAVVRGPLTRCYLIAGEAIPVVVTFWLMGTGGVQLRRTRQPEREDDAAGSERLGEERHAAGAGFGPQLRGQVSQPSTRWRLVHFLGCVLLGRWAARFFVVFVFIIFVM